MRRTATPTSNASLREIVSRNEVKRGPGAEVIVFSLVGARRHKAAAVQKRTTRGHSLSFISFEDVHDGFAALDMNVVGAERCAEAMHMLVRKRSSPAPAGPSEILPCRGDLVTRNHHERGTAWAHPRIRDTGRTPASGRSRRFEVRPMTSDLPRYTDIRRAGRHVSKVPRTDVAVE